MEFPIDVEEILSDDYEEGEILDGDDLYDEVSSLEEFSSGEEERSQLKNSNTATGKQNSVSEKKKQSTKHRRKDHKCKEDSVCRKERKGKHCYARIRKAKSSSKSKPVAETPPQSTVERVFPRKPDITLVMKHLKCRPSSPYKTRPEPPPKIPHRYDYKDYHEKENRHNNKRYWANPPRSKVKPPDKHVYYNRNKVNKDTHYSKHRYQSTTPPLPPLPPKSLSNENLSKTNETVSTDSTFSKTSLLKRLVGSGNTGVKPIKENEPSGALTKYESSKATSPEREIVPSCEEEGEVEKTPLESYDEVKPDLNKEEEKSVECQKTEQLPEPPKKIEVKWIRSMKDDKDELHLRVEALRSAWVKKFHERKKKGLIHQKKSDDVDDFLEDFALGSDIEEEGIDDTTVSKTTSVATESESVPHFNATDISGDILKPEDMVIVNEKTNEESIICETAVATTEGNSSVFVDPLFLSESHYSQNTNSHQVSNSNSNISLNITETSCNDVTTVDTSQKSWQREKKKTDSKHTSGRRKSGESNSHSSSSRVKSKKSRWRKRRKSKGTVIEATKNVANISADLDEEVLRELALLSVKSKNRSNKSTNFEEIGTNENESTNKGNTESTVIDNWEEDLDEDVLRAKLLSSLTKQVSEESAKLERATAIAQEPTHKEILENSKILKPTINLIKSSTSKKQLIKKLDRRKLKNTVIKKVWKQTNIFSKKNRPEVNIAMNHFGKSNVFKKSDNANQLQQNNTLSNVHIPQVAQMIISVDDSDSSSDMDNSITEPLTPLPTASLPLDIEANIDLLLREEMLNSQMEKGVIDNYSDPKEEKSKLTRNENTKQIANLVTVPDMLPTDSKRPNIKTPTSTSSSSSCSSIPTPQALKHLPAWQQEEYKRLKKKIAEKEKVLQVTRSKLFEPIKDINANNPIPSEGKSLANSEIKVLTSLNPNLSGSPVTVSPGLVPECPIPTSSSGSEPVNKCVHTVNKPTVVEHSATSEIIQNSKIDINKNSKIEKKCSMEDKGVAKKSFPNLVSCSIMEEINVMNDIVNDFEKNNSEYMDLKQKTARLKRILKVNETKMSVTKKRMFQIRDTITEKERQISSKIATFLMTNSSTSVEKIKPPSRDMELVKLKYKEVSLRAQFLFHDFLSEKVKAKENDKKVSDSILKPDVKESLPTGVKRTLSSKEIIPLKKKIAVPDSIVVKSVLPPEKTKDLIEAPMKRNFSRKEREREEWDPNTPVCHYDLNGICRDEECQYQHFKTV